MLEKVLELKRRYVEAQTEEEEDLINGQMRALIRENPDQWAKAMCESADDTARKATELAERVQREILEEDEYGMPIKYRDEIMALSKQANHNMTKRWEAAIAQKEQTKK
jgi:hypothetical protein